VSQPEDDPETFAYIGEDVRGSRRGELHMSSVPVEILDVVGEHNARDPAIVRQRHLERIALA
jgi:hypothetical protein